MATLGSLTEEQKNQAFLKAQAEIKLDDGKLIRITEEHYEQALEFLKEFFHKDEPLLKATGAKWGKDAIEMHMDALRQNLSVMIVNKNNGEIMALFTNQIVKKGNQQGPPQYADEGMRRDFKYIYMWERKANVFDHFNVEEAVQLDCLATNRAYRQKGLGTQVMQASLAMIRNCGLGRICVKGDGSSVYSQKVFEKEGMTCLYTANLEDYEEDGRKVFEGTGIHDSMRLYGMMVDS